MENTKEYKLYPPSEEQIAIIFGLANKNIWVQAVAGSGKTTTTLHIAQEFTKKKILLLTYNKKLSLETKEKIKLLNLTNLEVYTFHAFSAKTWQVNCQTDDGLIKIITNDLKPVRDLKYDLIIIDEAQDITPIYYEVLCKIISSNVNEVTLCILGDKNQSIYGFNDADPRYLVFANEVFNLNNLSWQHCKLSQSFRVNKQMVTFINDVFYDEKIMYSNISNDEKIEYIVANTFNSSQLVKEILKIIEKYGKDNVFLLAPSIKKDTSPAKKISNKLSDAGVLIYAPTNDDEKLDPEEMVNKLCLSTFHQAKGLERKAVVVFGFDISYFKYNAKGDDPLLPHNALYVAISRASEKLIIVHHIKNEPLPFLNKEKIKATTNFKIFANVHESNEFNSLFNKKFDRLDELNNPNVGVTNVLKYLPSAILSFCKKNIEMIEIKNNESKNAPKKLFNIPSKLKLEKNGEKYQENVSTITGTSTILNYQRITTNSSSPLKFLLNEIENNYDKTKKETPNLIEHTHFLKKLAK